MMIVQRGFAEPQAGAGGCLSIGNFDGVHRGHQQILGALVDQARELRVPAVVLTFDPHPIALLAPHRAPPALSTLSRKTELITACGVDVLLVVETTVDLLQLTPREFFDDVVRTRLEARGMVEGPNFCFGRDRGGDVGTLREFCESSGMSLHVVGPVEQDGAIVSSSAIRSAIAAGRLAEAVQMLGHPYQLEGRVVAGARRGREIGFPTANLADIATLLPADGVYAAVARPAGRAVPTAVHIGPNPTFGDDARKVEAHLIGFEGELYSRTLKVELLARVRATRTFDSREELVQQVQQDVRRVQEFVGAFPAGTL